MKKVYWYIAAIVLILIYIYFIETLPKGTVYYSFGSAFGYCLLGWVGASLWFAIENRKKK
jgi:hypothetical protein